MGADVWLQILFKISSDFCRRKNDMKVGKCVERIFINFHQASVIVGDSSHPLYGSFQ